jgi:hypothetical protein
MPSVAFPPQGVRRDAGKATGLQPRGFAAAERCVSSDGKGLPRPKRERDAFASSAPTRAALIQPWASPSADGALGIHPQSIPRPSGGRCARANVGEAETGACGFDNAPTLLCLSRSGGKLIRTCTPGDCVLLQMRAGAEVSSVKGLQGSVRPGRASWH